MKKIADWENFYLDWLSEADRDKLCVLHYENVKDQLPTALRKILIFLHIPLDEGRFQCTLEHSEGSFHRSSNKSDTALEAIGSDPFTEQQKNLIRKAILNVNQALINHGKESLPLDKYEFLA